MVWPASQQTLSEAFELADKTARAIRNLTLQVRNDSAAGPVSRSRIVDLTGDLDRAIDRWNQVAVVPGIVAYVREQKGDNTLDVAADFTAMVTQATALRDWIFANFPKDAGSGAWLVYDYGDNGVAIPLTFTVAQLAGFRTQADAFLATIS